VGRYVVLVTRDERARAEPGQFYMLSAARRWGGGAGERPYLGRAISVLRASDDGVVEFLLEDVGPGTTRLCELDAGDELALVGPFGNGFPEPGDAETVLVGGGIGIAPLLFAQQRWGGHALLGFRDATCAAAASLFTNPVVATDDGSAGHPGLVTELLAAHPSPRRIYACGPEPMLRALRGWLDVPTQSAVETQLALETPMACGFGACWGCVVETVDGYRRACIDGPVFEGRALRE